MTDDDPLDSTELAALARRGRAELDAFDRSTADDIWAGIQARLGPTTTTVARTSATPAASHRRFTVAPPARSHDLRARRAVLVCPVCCVPAAARARRHRHP